MSHPQTGSTSRNIQDANDDNRSLRFVKRYFYFSEEPVEVKSLSQYLQTEKASVAHPLAAWASQSGKGLLFFAKRAEDKATPAGILSLVSLDENAGGRHHTH